MSNDIVKDLLEANIKGIHPPQNWTSRAIDEIQSLRAKLSQPQEATASYTVHYSTTNLPKGTKLYTAPPNYEALLKDNERLRERLDERDALIAKKDETLEELIQASNDGEELYGNVAASYILKVCNKALALKVKEGE